MKKWLFIGFLIILTNCNKDVVSHHYIPQLFKDVGAFNKNSYWVYHNEKTLALDSTYVISDPQVYSIIDGSSIYDFINVPFDGHFFIQESLQETEVGLLSRIEQGSVINVFSDGTIVEKLDSMEVNNSKFINVYHTRQSSLTSQSDSITFDIYIVPHIGIIKLSKKLLETDTTFSIVRWRVFQ